MAAPPPYTTQAEAKAYIQRLQWEDDKRPVGQKKHFVPKRMRGTTVIVKSREVQKAIAFSIAQQKIKNAQTKEEKEELRKERLKNAQCVLMANMTQLVRANGVAATEALNAPPPTAAKTVTTTPATKAKQAKAKDPQWGIQRLVNILPYMGTPESALGQLLNPINCSEFVNAPTPYLATLVPRLEFFIQDKTSVKQVFFSDFTLEKRSHAIAESLSSKGGKTQGFERFLKSSLGAGVGIESFTWNYDNKHEGDRIIKASLTLLFASVTELVKSENYLEFTTLRGTSQGTTASLVDASGRTQSDEDKLRAMYKSLKQKAEAAVQGDKFSTQPKIAPNPADKEKNHKMLKVIVGWSVPTAKNLKIPGYNWQKFRTAVRASQKVINLQLVNYGVDFQEQGQVKLTLDMVGSLDQYFMSPQADVLKGAAIHQEAPGKRTFPVVIEPRDTELADGDLLAKAAKNWNLVFGGGAAPKAGDTAWRYQKLMPNGRLRIAFASAIHRAHSEKMKQFSGPLWLKNLRASRAGAEIMAGNVGLTLDEVEGEIEYLEQYLDMLEFRDSLTGTNKSFNSPDPYQAEYWSRGMYQKGRKQPTAGHQASMQSKENVKLWLQAAQEILDELRAVSRSERYSVFLKMLFATRRLFFVEMDVSDFNNKALNTSSPPTPARINLRPQVAASNTSAKQANKILATVNNLGKNAKEIEMYAGALDPLADKTDKIDDIENGKVPVFFLRLGDLIDVALQNFQLRESEKVILGTFDPKQLGLMLSPEDNMKYINIADIPISMDYFGQWFLDHVSKKEIDVYPFRNFVNDLLNGMVAPLINYECNAFKSKTAATLRFDFATVNSYINLADAKRTYEKGRVITESDLKKIFNDAAKRKLGALTLVSDRSFHYFIIHTAQMSPDRTGKDEKKDSDAGIYHLKFGADRGLVKRMSFSEKTMPHLRAMNIEGGTGDTRAGVLILPQDVTVDMVGNALFRNGQIVFINADMAVGTSIARKLKLGGYYRVVKSDNEISMSGFTTRLDCMYERNPGTED